MTTMPAEVTNGVVASILGAVFVILGAWDIEVTQEVSAAVITLVGWIAFGVTLWVRRNRGRELAEVPEGTAPEDGA